MNVKIKLTQDKYLPVQAHIGDAGYDVRAAEDVTLMPNVSTKIKLGFAMEIPLGVVAELRGRSGLALEGIHCHLGTIDSGYRGEVSAILTNLTTEIKFIKTYDRIAQLVFTNYTNPNFILSDNLSDTARDTGGFGSSGIK